MDPGIYKLQEIVFPTCLRGIPNELTVWISLKLESSATDAQNRAGCANAAAGIFR